MALTAPRIYIMQPGYWGCVWWQLRKAAIALHEDGCFGIAKGVAYSALLSFFPVLTSLATVLVQAQLVDISPIISQLLTEALPPGTEQLVLSHFVAQGQRPTSLLVAAVILSVFAASGAMLSLMEGFQAVYRIPTGRPFLKQRGMAIVLVFSLAVPLLGASSLILFGQRFERNLLFWLRLIPETASFTGWLAVVGVAARYLVAFGAFVLVSIAMYYFGPNRKQSIAKVWPGAIVSTTLWLVATVIFAWYVRNIANYNVLYGSVGAVIALLVWQYVLAVVALMGCEYNAVRERAQSTT
ncbi:MAG: YihY/virulence factor BrkB family protein [Bryobacteraceae bacterium]